MMPVSQLAQSKRSANRGFLSGENHFGLVDVTVRLWFGTGIALTPQPRERILFEFGADKKKVVVVMMSCLFVSNLCVCFCQLLMWCGYSAWSTHAGAD